MSHAWGGVRAQLRGFVRFYTFILAGCAFFLLFFFLSWMLDEVELRQGVLLTRLLPTCSASLAWVTDRPADLSAGVMVPSSYLRSVGAAQTFGLATLPRIRVSGKP